MSQRVSSGYGSHQNLSSVLKHFSPRKIFLVSGKKSYATSGAAEALQPALADYTIVQFTDYLVNPHAEDLKTGVALFKKNGCDLVLGVGGGTPMDLAKSIAILATQPGDIEKYVKGQEKMSPRQIPLVLLPTTAGTGSEATHFSVIYIDKVKHSLGHRSMLPDHVILDPTFTLNLSPEITATTSIDALSQGIESFWSVKSTEESRNYSQQAIQLILANIVANYKSPDRQTRENMLQGSYLAGKAINIAQTTASHAFSYPITSHFGVAHGHAVGLTLPYLLELNSEITAENVQDPRGIDFALEIMKKLQSLQVTKQKLISLMDELHLEKRLSNLGVPPEGKKIIVENGFAPDRIRNNPRTISRTDLEAIIDKIF